MPQASAWGLICYIMDNKITIDLDAIRNAPDNSITSAETIRQIAILGLEGGEHLEHKIKKECLFAGLYPHIQTIYNIKPKQ